MRRKHYLIAYGIPIAVLITASVAFGSINPETTSIIRMIIIGLLIPSTVKRIHDVGHSGWLCILALGIPLFSLLLLVLPGVSGSNKFGEDPKRSAEDR